MLPAFTIIASDVAVQFSDLADTLLNRFVICSGKAQFRVTEIEFYHTGRGHLDPFVHGMRSQDQSGTWYFHQTLNGGIKGGSRKGLDISIGNPESGSQGGILLRAMLSISNPGDYVYGPSKLVDRLILESGMDEKVFVSKFNAAAINESDLLHLEIADIRHELVLRGSRFGLPLKSHDDEIGRDYHGRAYRYYTFPLLKHADKENALIPYLMKNQILSHEEILRLFGRKTLPKLL